MEVWNDCIIKIIYGGKIKVGVDDEIWPYFDTFWGFIWGDPLFSLLFDLANDALLIMIHKRYTILQFANNTIFLLPDDLEHARNIKFLLSHLCICQELKLTSIISVVCAALKKKPWTSRTFSPTKRGNPRQDLVVILAVCSGSMYRSFLFYFFPVGFSFFIFPFSFVYFYFFKC